MNFRMPETFRMLETPESQAWLERQEWLDRLYDGDRIKPPVDPAWAVVASFPQYCYYCGTNRDLVRKGKRPSPCCRLPECEECGEPSNDLVKVYSCDAAVGYSEVSRMCPECRKAMERRAA